MDTIKTKLTVVFIPFLLAAIGTVLFYNIFRWTLDLKLGVLPLKDDVLNLWIPITLPWVSVLIWLRRRLRVLNIQGKNGSGHFIYQLVMVMAMVVPMVMSQNYLEKNTFDLIEVGSVSEVKALKKEKYFKIETFKVDFNSSLPYITSRSSGRNNEDLNFYLYLACPFESTTTVWYGVEYNKKVNNRISDQKKDSEYRNFLTLSEDAFNTYNFQEVTYFEKLGYSDDRDGYLEAIEQKNPDFEKSEHIVLVPKKDRFEDRLGQHAFLWIFGSFGIGAFIVLILVLFPKIDDKELSNFKKKKPLQEDDVKDILNFLNPLGEYKTTAILLLINIVVFLIMVGYGLNIMSPTPKELLEIGGHRRFEVLNGDYWRLFTSMFIHGGIMHLFMNLLGLGLASHLLEKVLGAVKLMVIYMICGLLASLASIYWHEHTISVGASGAIFGLYGLILAFTLFKIYPKYILSFNWILLGLYAGISLVFGFFGGIDNAAHFGGLISGFIVGGILILSNKTQLQEKAK
ncbi:rhomboid family intramembrane serine protease [uncultured Psychroserpens sp.]|uniref:rhomboid family intramembrane serine protease n=1 Tax=uncultured Psychroserpens sp. TaxID=255436 RepID=UPI0026067EB9|nr:rhomboid family intramembrane serine protease [uncultured Psychroserpens sp.]